MSINCKQLRELVVRPTLEYLGLWSAAAENLLLGTAAQESAMGKYIKQITGPALGIYQMEPATHVDILNNYLSYKNDLRESINALQLIAHAPNSYILADRELIGNLYYATAMARVHYLRVPEELPKADDIVGLASYWKSYYNTPLGKGTVEEFVKNYGKYVDDQPIKRI